MTVERLEWSLLEAQELLDSLPILSPNPSQDTRDRIYVVNELFEELIDKAAAKGYVHTQARTRQQRPDNPSNDPSQPASPQVCYNFMFLNHIDSQIAASTRK